ncbi:MAG: tryptophan synthase subunit alpha [Planctomycetota bacterium]|nr:tryptophan synthase subunit alpha [Planctomycetota bacterium]
MNRIDEVFQELRRVDQCALIPFITAGDPDLETTRPLIQALADAGADLVELGMPYSDPIADGPVIQAAYNRALSRNIQLGDILDCVAKRSKEVSVESENKENRPPLISMISYSLVFRYGPEAFFKRAVQSGFDGAIIPDLPVQECGDISKVAADQGLCLIQLITPTTPMDRAETIVNSTTGFIYYVSVTGITGERTQLPASLGDRIQSIRNLTDLPVCVGFGISQPDQVQELREIADGVIVGSAIVRRMEENKELSQAEQIAEVGEFVATLKKPLIR